VQPADEIDWALARRNLLEARRWLAAGQPAAVTMSHHGPGGFYCGGGLRVSPSSMASRGRTGPGRVVIVASLGTPDDLYRAGIRYETAERGFVPEIQEPLQEVVRDVFGATNWIEDWNGGPGIRTYSMAVNAVTSAGVRRALRTYYQGCPDHGGTVFCNGWQNGAHNEGCTYMLDTGRRLVLPAYVDAQIPTVGEELPLQRSGNAERVAQAIERWASTLAEYGIHPSTINGGVVGEITGLPGARQIVYRAPEQGQEEPVGVVLPAEAFELLARLAAQPPGEVGL